MRARPATISRSRSPQELQGVPKFRRFGGYGAYAEGWGLYAEGLGKEMGFYREPISEFGMYSTQLWRAIRLVVDTGIHRHRWTRERAIDYFHGQRPALASATRPRRSSAISTIPARRPAT